MHRSGRREARKPRSERQATINRREGVRSRYRRCPKCKKLRMYVLPANYRWSRPFGDPECFTDWVKLEDGTKICHICAGVPPSHTVESDGITVWVNGVGGLLGRFGKAGIDIHRPMTEQQKGECLFCTHAFVTKEDWAVFRLQMRKHFNIKIPNRYLPERFR